MMKRYGLFLSIPLVILLLLAHVYARSRSQGRIRGENEDAVQLRAVSFISPHHLMAENLIEDIFDKFYQENGKARVETVILISPNHFNQSFAPVIIPDVAGEGASMDSEAVNLLLKESSIFAKEDSKAEKDHGIYNLLPYISRYWPDGKIIPLMIRDSLSKERVEEISKILREKYNGRVIMILSSDFSHYAGWEKSTIHDKASIDAISDFKTDEISRLDMDCRGGLRILLDFSKDNGYTRFNLVRNSSSSEMIGRDLGSLNTSYVTGYFSRVR